MTDRIVLSGVSGTGFHGVFDHEKRDGQTFVVDVAIDADLAAAGRSDDLSRTVNYGEIGAVVLERIEGEPFELIERLGVRFQFNTQVGEGVTLNDLAHQYDAVFLAIGTWKEAWVYLPGTLWEVRTSRSTSTKWSRRRPGGARRGCLPPCTESRPSTAECGRSVGAQGLWTST